MREIKFRAWVKSESRYYNQEELELYSGDDIFDTKSGYWQLEQFTGLKDKKGVDGYEGDIVKYKVRSYKNDQKSREEIGVILWDNMKAGFYIAPSNMYNYFKDGKNGSFRGEHLNLKTKEIIGNIHQNPELLK